VSLLASDRLSKRIARKLLGVVAVPVTLLIAGSANAAPLTLSWVDNSGGTAGFKIERKTGATGTYAQIGTTAAGVTTYQDNTVVGGTTYCYHVRAWNTAGNSGYSNEACDPPVVEPPPPPSTGPVVTAVKTGAGSGTVTSSPPGISCGSDCFESFPSSTSSVTLTATPANGSTFSGWATGCSGTGSCTVTGNSAVTVTAAFAAVPAGDTTPPTPVNGLVASMVSSSQINLNWNASTDAVGVTGYRVERCYGRKCSNFVQIATLSGTSYNDTGCSPDTRYRYRVRAADQAGNLGGYSQVVDASTFKSGR
jgi:hypothetical protein